MTLRDRLHHQIDRLDAHQLAAIDMLLTQLIRPRKPMPVASAVSDPPYMRAQRLIAVHSSPRTSSIPARTECETLSRHPTGRRTVLVRLYHPKRSNVERNPLRHARQLTPTQRSSPQLAAHIHIRPRSGLARMPCTNLTRERTPFHRAATRPRLAHLPNRQTQWGAAVTDHLKGGAGLVRFLSPPAAVYVLFQQPTILRATLIPRNLTEQMP